MAYKVIHNSLAESNRGGGGVSAEKRDPVGIVPADARLRLLGSEKIVSILGSDLRSLHSSHQAGIKTDHIKGDAAFRQRLVNSVERHGPCALELLVIAVAGERAAAVIPQDQHVPVGRIVLRTEADKLRQGGRCDHGLVAHIVVEQAELTAVFNLVDLVGVALHQIVLPLGTAAGVDNNIDVISDGGIRHFLQVLGRHGVIGLKVSAAHEHHNGHGVISVPLDGGELGPCPVRHSVILYTGVVAAAPCGRGIAAAVDRGIPAEQ